MAPQPLAVVDGQGGSHRPCGGSLRAAEQAADVLLREVAASDKPVGEREVGSLRSWRSRVPGLPLLTISM
jgi:hypothetical protein